MVMNPSFLPDPTRAQQMDAHMRHGLSESLRSVYAQTCAQRPDLMQTLAPVKMLAARIVREAKPVPPPLYTAYYQLVIALDAAPDSIAEKVAQLRSVATLLDEEPSRFVEFNATGLGGEDRIALYRFALDNDPTSPFSFCAPQTDQSEATRASIERAFRLMGQATPALRAEFDALVHQIVLAAPGNEAGGGRFDGASSYMLWGALALSVDRPQSDLARLETLAHECAHSLLFGFCVDEPLVLNSEEERFSSPLRTDARPMDGIYHATYVSARMFYAIHTAFASGTMSEEQKAEAHTLMASSQKAFFDGLVVVDQHGLLSETGQSVMDAARAFMQSHAGEPAESAD